MRRPAAAAADDGAALAGVVDVCDCLLSVVWTQLLVSVLDDVFKF